MATIRKPRLLKIYNSLKQKARLKSGYVPAKVVRQQFIDYFKSLDHQFVKSCSVKPFGDPTLDFVNAGMNQFKNVFLGLSEAPGSRIVNSQKCIRIGGKHNDLNAVGLDAYHHTFFEMLGNWSFGEYFKKEACRYAWKLITSPPYSIPKERLYVTYHGGDPSAHLDPDFETQTIWKEIGVPENRILPFSSKDNFWEMAATGPCGPCTEIHYDHLGSELRADRVNADSSDLTELWNLVFIQYKRGNDGILTPLKQSFVDTGMGLERLVAVIQGKRSTYDTDLFHPLFDCISRTAKIRPYSGKFYSEDENLIDTNYRILADHVRMIVVAICDSVFPENSHGLRRVVRKCLMAADKFMPGKGLILINELIKEVEESLGSVYPEISRNIRQVEYVMRDEVDTWASVKASVKNDWEKLVADVPKLSSLSDVQSFGLTQAVKELQTVNLNQGDTLSKELGVILYGRYGLAVPLLVELADLFGYKVDQKELQTGIEELKKKNRDAMVTAMKLDLSDDHINYISSHFQTTDDNFKYSCSQVGDEYQVEPLDCQVLCVTRSNQIVPEGSLLKTGDEVCLLLNKTNFWTSSKGDGDIGRLSLLNDEGRNIGRVDITRAVRFGNYIVHFGLFHSSSGKDELIMKWSAKLNVEMNQRLTLMRNTTAAHIFDHILKQKYTVNMQGFSNTKHNFTVEYSVYGHNISEGEILILEHLVNGIIRENRNVSQTNATPSQLFGDDQVPVPSFLNIQSNYFPVVQVEGFSRVMSFGPNVLNTKDINEFCLVGIEVNKKKRGFVVKGVTGENVDGAYKETDRLISSLRDLNELSTIEEMEKCLSDAKRLVRQNLVPMTMRIELNHLVNELEPALTNKVREDHVKGMRDAINKVVETGRPYIIHNAGKDAKLEKLTRLCPEYPVMIFAYNNGLFTARCCTPKAGKLLASDWAGRVARELGSTPQALKGHDPKFVCYVKPMKMSWLAANRLAPTALEVAKDAVEELLSDKSELSGSR